MNGSLNPSCDWVGCAAKQVYGSPHKHLRRSVPGFNRKDGAQAGACPRASARIDMSTAICKCGHEKRDHRMLPLALQGYGECKVCLCGAYTKQEAVDLRAAQAADLNATVK